MALSWPRPKKIEVWHRSRQTAFGWLLCFRCVTAHFWLAGPSSIATFNNRASQGLLETQTSHSARPYGDSWGTGELLWIQHTGRNWCAGLWGQWGDKWHEALKQSKKVLICLQDLTGKRYGHNHGKEFSQLWISQVHGLSLNQLGVVLETLACVPNLFNAYRENSRTSKNSAKLWACTHRVPPSSVSLPRNC
jgi:hypothetical protein